MIDGVDGLQALRCEMIQCGADGGEIEHPESDTRMIGRRPVVAPPGEARPAGRAQQERPNHGDPVVRIGNRQGQHVGGVLGEITDSRAPVTPDEAAKSTIATRDGAPRTVEAEVAIGHRPGNVRIVDERSAPGRQDLVEGVGGCGIAS